MNPAILTIKLPQRLHAENTVEIEERLDLTGVEHLVLDFQDCTYISSAGIRTVLVAHQRMTKAQGTMTAANVGAEVLHVFDITGLSQIVRIKKKLREISLEGIELFSEGVCGECYRLDRDTVVKLYREGLDQETAEREKQYARAAFIMGIPTAISYDLVSCRGRSGIVYEMLDAELLSSRIRNDGSNVDRYAKILSDVAKTIHTAGGDPSILPNLKASFREHIQKLDGHVPAEDIQLLARKLEAMPDAVTCVHFDLHTSNVMMRKGEPVIIDMGDLSIGSNLFDIGLLFFVYGIPELGLSELVTRIPTELGLEFWNRFEEHYFADRSTEEHAVFRANRYFLASFRLIFSIAKMPTLRENSARMLRDTLLPRIKREEGTTLGW